MIKASVVVPQVDYAGGLNAAENPIAIKDNESPDCLNVHTNIFGSVEKRKGKAKLNSSAVGGGATGNASLDFELSATTRLLCTIFGNTLYKMDSLDGTYDSITMAVAIGSGRAELRPYLRKLIIASHVSGNIQSWDGSAGTTATISGAAAFRYIWPDDISGRLWATGLAGNEGVAYFSPVNTLSFDTTNDKIQISNTDVLLGFRNLRGRLYAFGRRGWYRIDDLGGDPRFGARFVCGPGTMSPESVQSADILGIGEGLIYVDTAKQLRFFQGTDTARLSYKFDHRSSFSSARTLDRLLTSRFDEVHAVVYPTRNWYMLHYTGGSDSENNDCLIYDLNSKSAWPFSAVSANTACIARDDNGNIKLMQTGYSGYTWQADSGNDDDGAAIPSYYTWSRKPAEEGAGRRGQLHKWRQVALALKALGEYSITLKVRMDFITGFTTLKVISLRGTGATLGSFVLGADVLGGVDSVLDVIGIDRIGRHCQLRLEDTSANPAWQLFGDDMASRTLGVY